MWTRILHGTQPHDSPQQNARPCPAEPQTWLGTSGVPALWGGEFEQPGSPEIDACVTAQKGTDVFLNSRPIDAGAGGEREEGQSGKVVLHSGVGLWQADGSAGRAWG